ncbi:MAG: hypothetical protein LUG49_08725 [Oscillospiraceae bacterium]|nr:hypothetical protein [Oscillospiraceae bacterium]
MDKETTGAYEEPSFEMIAMDDDVYIICSISDAAGGGEVGGGGLIYDD